MREDVKWPMFMLGFLLGLMVGFLVSDAFGQSYVPGQGGLYRQPNQYDSGGMTPTPQGPVYDYGVPKYQAPQPSTLSPMLYYGMGRRAVEREVKARQQAEVQALTERIRERTAETCAKVDALNELREAFGLERTAACQ